MNAAFFAGQALAFHFTERSRWPWLRWLGNTLAALGKAAENRKKPGRDALAVPTESDIVCGYMSEKFDAGLEAVAWIMHSLRHEEPPHDECGGISEVCLTEVIERAYVAGSAAGFEEAKRQAVEAAEPVDGCLATAIRRLKQPDPVIEDGFGSTWSKRCPNCGELTMEVVRPGKVQCGKCG